MHRSLCCLVSAIALLSGCATLEEAAGSLERPTFTFQTAALEDVSPNGATVRLTYLLDNPYPVELPLSRLDYQVDVEGRPLANGDLPTGLHVPPHGRAPVALRAHVDFAGLLPTLGGVLGSPTLRYRVRGTVTADSPVGPVNVAFSDSGNVSLSSSPRPAFGLR